MSQSPITIRPTSTREPSLEQLRAASHDSPQAFAAYAYRLRAFISLQPARPAARPSGAPDARRRR